MGDERSSPTTPAWTGYLAQALFLVLGSAITLAATVITNDRQAKSQMRQFVLDRQISTLKEYTTSVNQSGVKVLMSVREVTDRLDTLDQKLIDEGKLPEDDEAINDFLRLSRNFQSAWHEFSTNLATQRTMVNAVFGSDLLPDASKRWSDKQVKEWQQKWQKIAQEIDAPDVDETQQLQTLRKVMLELDGVTAQIINAENEDVQKLAKEIYKQRNSL